MCGPSGRRCRVFEGQRSCDEVTIDEVAVFTISEGKRVLLEVWWIYSGEDDCRLFFEWFLAEAFSGESRIWS